MRRSPRGERGLKSLENPTLKKMNRSLPSRGAWIEIDIALAIPGKVLRRSPRGERGLKLFSPFCWGLAFPVAPLAGSVD